MNPARFPTVPRDRKTILGKFLGSPALIVGNWAALEVSMHAEVLRLRRATKLLARA